MAAITFVPHVGFMWSMDDGTRIEVAYEFPLPSIQPQSADNIVLSVWAEKHNEADVLQVVVDKTSCGWLFTVGAFESSLHEKKDDKYFRAAAWSVCKYLIEKNQNQIEKLYQQDRKIRRRLGEFLDEDLSIFCLYKPMLSRRIIDNPDIILPQLLRKGIYPWVSEKTKTLTRPVFSNAEHIKISSDVPVDGFHKFYIDLLVSHIPYVEMAVFRFYLFYQIIESMMEGVLAKVGKSVIKDIAASLSDVINIHDAIESYRDKTGEKSRIVKVFDCLVDDSVALERLRTASLDFLKAVEPSIDTAALQNKPAATSLYRVRNQLIHNYRRSIVAMPYLDDILVELEYLVPTLVCNFSDGAVEDVDEPDLSEFWFSPS